MSDELEAKHAEIDRQWVEALRKHYDENDTSELLKKAIEDDAVMWWPPSVKDS